MAIARHQTGGKRPGAGRDVPIHSASKLRGVARINAQVISTAIDDGAAFSVLFAAGCRPDASAISAACARIADVGAADGGHDLELIASGLAFDISGHAPNPPAPTPGKGQPIGVSDNPGDAAEAMRLVPGEHIASASRQLAVIRVMSGIAAAIATLPDVRAVVWHGAGTWIEPNFFAAAVAAWLEGGPFPAPGLIGIARTGEGEVASNGLTFFTGQEMLLYPTSSDEPARLAVRVIDMLVTHGKVDQTERFDGPGGESWLATPSADGKRVVIRRAD